ncbi:MAG: VTT domain-containing protein [Planctomycetota bacterium]|nr:VTT domain-containing protein [Planctomycetota bacterium]
MIDLLWLADLPPNLLSTAAGPGLPLPGGLEFDPSSSLAWKTVLIILATFILEDPTSIAVGLLVRAGSVPPVVGVLATMAGIFIGDLGLYFMGRFAGRALSSWDWLSRRFPPARLNRLRHWFDAHGWTAILASRFMPGTRVPLYVAIGAARGSVLRFAVWTALAVSIWVPVLVIGTAWLGGTILGPFQVIFGDGLVAWIAVGLVLLVSLHLLSLAFTSEGRLHLRVFCARLRRWEFWSPWAFYGPILPWFIFNYIRLGCMRTATAVDPCWPDGGAIGESKQRVLDLFPCGTVEPSFRCQPDEDPEAALDRVQASTWGWPVILKPDEGQRGAGVHLVYDPDELRARLQQVRIPVVLQRYHPGPGEVGLFWWRYPGESSGRLFTICHKVFPVVEGDGTSTLRDLIVNDSRLRLQFKIFFKRFEDRLDEVLPVGESLQLTRAGNHAQGCLFLDGEHLRTPELEAWLDEVCAAVPGFNYGRLDVRYASTDELKRGEGLSIIEANGLGSESTNMYDPSFSLFRAWSLVRIHWIVAMKIGRINRAHGVAGINEWEYLKNWFRWRRLGRSSELSD